VHYIQCPMRGTASGRAGVEYALCPANCPWTIRTQSVGKSVDFFSHRRDGLMNGEN